MAEKVLLTHGQFVKDNTWFYFVDNEGDISRAPRKYRAKTAKTVDAPIIDEIEVVKNDN